MKADDYIILQFRYKETSPLLIYYIILISNTDFHLVTN